MSLSSSIGPVARLLRRARALVGCAAMVTATFLLGPTGTAHADPGDERKATILVKALSFDLDLDTRIGDELVVAIVSKPGDPGSEAVAASWSRAFSQLTSLRVKNAPVRAIRVPFDIAAIDASIQKNGVDVLLVCDGLDSELDAITRLALARKVITIGAKRSYVERSLVLGAFLEEEKPRIVVNMTAARQGGFRFSSSVLRVATLVK